MVAHLPSLYTGRVTAFLATVLVGTTGTVCAGTTVVFDTTGMVRACATVIGNTSRNSVTNLTKIVHGSVDLPC